MPTIEIFRAGRHTAMSGHVVEYSENDLRMMAAAYAPARSRAVLTLGHPPDNTPDLGTVEKLTAIGSRLFAVVSNVADKAVSWVRAGHYKHVSASFMAPYALGNPVPGTWYLRHVGMLGATAPAVKGMAPLEFAGGQEGHYLCFADPNSNAGVGPEVAETLATLTNPIDFAAPAGFCTDTTQMALYREARQLSGLSGLSFADAAIVIQQV